MDATSLFHWIWIKKTKLSDREEDVVGEAKDHKKEVIL
jgi:hypothetical protein